MNVVLTKKIIHYWWSDCGLIRDVWWTIVDINIYLFAQWCQTLQWTHSTVLWIPRARHGEQRLGYVRKYIQCKISDSAPVERQGCRQSVLLIVLLSHISFPLWWKWRKFWQHFKATLAWKNRVSLVGANMVYVRKTMMMRCKSYCKYNHYQRFLRICCCCSFVWNSSVEKNAIIL